MRLDSLFKMILAFDIAVVAAILPPDLVIATLALVFVARVVAPWLEEA